MSDTWVFSGPELRCELDGVECLLKEVRFDLIPPRQDMLGSWTVTLSGPDAYHVWAALDRSSPQLLRVIDGRSGRRAEGRVLLQSGPMHIEGSITLSGTGRPILHGES